MPSYGTQEDEHMHHHSMNDYAPADRGCAMCRSELNCSLAVHNHSAGVFCGDVLSTFQPCCCTFRNECMTTIFSNSCECFDGEREEELMSTRFYLFVGLSFIAWGLLVYDKMCSGPYKVMNSSHQLLASSPSAAQARGEDSIVATVDSDSEDDENTGSSTTNATAADLDVGESDDALLRPHSPSSRSEEAESSSVVVTVDSSDHSSDDQKQQQRDPTSIQSV
ncbi:hypothetical protein BBJ28_00001366 [Nothophytophthora sp. Chile5]|nr:hypothetical protein BBJ28_00001366 [Nothophytophthora sp. Chile5]